MKKKYMRQLERLAVVEMLYMARATNVSDIIRRCDRFLAEVEKNGIKDNETAEMYESVKSHKDMFLDISDVFKSMIETVVEAVATPEGGGDEGNTEISDSGAGES